MSTQFDPAENNLPQVPPAAASGSDETIDVLNDETTRDSEREQHITDGVIDGSENEAPAKPRRRRGRGARAVRREQPEAEATPTTPDGILQLPVRGEAQPPEQRDEGEGSGESDQTVAVAELEAQGFTADEAIRLVHVSDRVATSREAREAEATLRRLRFTRWLVERGMLDEFSA